MIYNIGVIGLKLRFMGLLFGLGAALGGGTAAEELLLFTEAPRYESASTNRFPSGATLQVLDHGQKRPLVPSFAASADAAVSFDGRTVLFSGKQKPGDPWQIWEVPVAGGAAKRITSVPADAITPFYISADRIVYSRRTPIGFQLEVVPVEGSYVERLTYAPGDHLATGVLRDGRVLFQAPLPGATGVDDLYTVYIDGSGVESYRCDHGRDRRWGVETASGDIVFETGGRLARFTSARAVQVDLPAVKGEFAGPVAEGATGEKLVSFRQGAGQPFGIYKWQIGKDLPEKVWATAGVHSVQPVLVRPHPVPKRHPSALGNRTGANLLCLNAYTSKSPIPEGSLASVRVWALDDAGNPTILGQTGVESDGSFFVQTPSERAIRFELLDKAGKTVAAEKGWFWARQGEQRVCVGCHAGPERAPSNAVPQTLLHTTDPAKTLLRDPQ